MAMKSWDLQKKEREKISDVSKKLGASFSSEEANSSHKSSVAPIILLKSVGVRMDSDLHSSEK